MQSVQAGATLAPAARAPVGEAGRAPIGGRPRRRWRGLGVVIIVVVVLAGSAALVVRHGRAHDPETGGYPQRIGLERPSDRLPDRPGPLAATLTDNDFGNARNLGVTPTGRLFELPSGTTWLSPSGTILLSQPSSRRRQLGLHDLTTGEQWVLRTSALQDYAGVSWSPDESAVLGGFAPAGHPRQQEPAVLDIGSGVLTKVGAGAPAGFRSPSEPVTLRRVGGPSAPGGIVATTTDLDTGATSDLALSLDHSWLGTPHHPLVASVAPDGRTLLVVEDSGSRTGDTVVRLFSLVDGTELAPRSVRAWDGCPPSWRGQDPVLPTTAQPGGQGSARTAGAALLSGQGSTSLVAVHFRLQSTCLQLTTAALAAGPRWALFGTSTATWTWYWLPGLIVATLALVGLLLLFRAVRGGWRMLPG
jgi:hypothetical protein